CIPTGQRPDIRTGPRRARRTRASHGIGPTRSRRIDRGVPAGRRTRQILPGAARRGRGADQGARRRFAEAARSEPDARHAGELVGGSKTGALAAERASAAFSAWLQRELERFEARASSELPPAEHTPQRLCQAIRYAALGGGKRVRPLLVYAAGDCVQP